MEGLHTLLYLLCIWNWKHFSCPVFLVVQLVWNGSVQKTQRMKWNHDKHPLLGFFNCLVLSISSVQCLYIFFTFCVSRRVSLTPVSLRSPAVSSLFNTPSSTEKAKHGQWEQLQHATNIHYWGLRTYEGKWKIDGKRVPSPLMEFFSPLLYFWFY